jgi:hypothetical protein
MVQSCIRAFALVLAAAVAAPLAADFQSFGPHLDGARIRGRVIDPHQLRPQDLTLMVKQLSGDTGPLTLRPIPIGADGSFTIDGLGPAPYLLELIRSPHSATAPATPVGLTLVSVETSDLSNVTVEVRPDTAVTGTFRMDSDNPAAVWPTSIGVSAWLALDGMTFLGSRGADGARGGRFVLRNAFGPRVLRCHYELAPDSKWWPSLVTLDGVDITNVPIDFSEHEDGRLEVFFTQHPSRIRGVVRSWSGDPVRAPWILVAAAEPAFRQHWSTMLYAVQGGTRGEFTIAVIPGQYRVAAFLPETFASYQDARNNVLRRTSAGVPIEVKTREIKDVSVTIQNRARGLANHFGGTMPFTCPTCG